MRPRDSEGHGHDGSIAREGTDHQTALSELIGFVLLLVVIITAVSVYLIYAVPAQGREMEILHMNEIRDQFTTYKVGVDALWLNNQLNSAMSTTFNLGTLGAATQGGFSFLPIVNPVPSSGTLALNQRGEVLIVTSRGMIGDGNFITNQTAVPGTLMFINATPQKFFVNISDSSPTTLGRRSVLLQGQDWSVNVTVNPKTTYYNYSKGCTLTTCNYYDGTMYAGTDITMAVNKSGIITLQNYVVYRDIQTKPPGTVFTVDLLDDVYGLKNYLNNMLYPMNVTLTKIPPSSSITGFGNVSFGDEYERVASHQIALGSLQYTVLNNYWIPQAYYYQNGGVFLMQDNGTSVKLPPTIIFSYDGTTRITSVRIIELPFRGTDTGNLAGNNPAQVKTQVTDIQNLSYSRLHNNTRWINLSITSGDKQAVAAWIGALDMAANITGGVPTTHYTASATGTTGYFYIFGVDASNSWYDIHVEGLRANLSAAMQGG